MKILLSIIILLIPFSILAKQICIAPSGCRIEMDTGFCPKCIFEKDEPIIKEEKLVVEKKPKVSQSKDRKPITRERNWVGQLFECIVGCKKNVKYWDEGNNEYDKNLNLLSTN